MKITNIEETTFNYPETGWHSSYEGIVIALDNGETYKLGIDNNSQCCEHWGYITSNDKYDNFIGAEFIDCRVTTQELCTIEDLPDVYEGGMMFFTISTNKGDLQFVAYNEHNGYYSHDVLLVKDTEVIEKGYV